jgi:hypothetical protein
VKKLFALLAVFSLAAVGCQDSKTSNKPAGTGGTYDKTNKVEAHTTVKVTDTIVEHKQTETKVGTEHANVKVPDKTKPEGPSTPPKGDSKDKDGK